MLLSRFVGICLLNLPCAARPRSAGLIDNCRPLKVYEERVLPLVKQIVELCLRYKGQQEFSRLVQLDRFMPMLDLFRKQSKYEVFKTILAQFGNGQWRQAAASSEPLVVLLHVHSRMVRTNRSIVTLQVAAAVRPGTRW